MLGIRDETFLLSNANMAAGVYNNVDSTSRPSGAEESGFVLHIRSKRAENYFRCAYYFEGGSDSATRRRVYINIYRSGWGGWKEISTDIPTFYKNYGTLVALATGIAGAYEKAYSLPSGQSDTFTIPKSNPYGLFVVTEFSGRGITQLYLYTAESTFLIAVNGGLNSANATRITTSISNSVITITNADTVSLSGKLKFISIL